jgi:hypothetical protein
MRRDSIHVSCCGGCKHCADETRRTDLTSSRGNGKVRCTAFVGIRDGRVVDGPMATAVPLRASRAFTTGAGA